MLLLLHETCILFLRLGHYVALEFGHYFGSGCRLEAGLGGFKTEIGRLEQLGILDRLLSQHGEQVQTGWAGSSPLPFRRVQILICALRTISFKRN